MVQCSLAEFGEAGNADEGGKHEADAVKVIPSARAASALDCRVGEACDLCNLFM